MKLILNNMEKYTPVIGMEVHIEPDTNSKMFCACPQDHFGKTPNTQVCPVCLGLPGALPIANKEAVFKTIKLGLALGSAISTKSRFYRKNYFYPDLPKAFQTSQLDNPICVGGSLNGFTVNHIHLEEDAGKLVHETIEGNKYSLIDFNRSGCALIELVTEPVFKSIQDVIAFVKELQLISRYIGVSSADMEKGSMRLEANISLQKPGETNLPNYKVELKNINSFKFLEKAVNAEIKRQSEALDSGEELIQETRGYDEIKQKTFSQRTKADAHDYRYFPEADLAPMEFDDSEIEELKNKLPELPAAKRQKFVSFGLNEDFANILVSDLSRAEYFEKAVELGKDHGVAVKTIADAMINKKLDNEFKEAAGLIKRIVEVSKVEFSGLEEVEKAVEEVVNEQEKAVTDYKNGNGNVVGFLIGMSQKKLQGKGNPQTVRELLLKSLNG